MFYDNTVTNDKQISSQNDQVDKGNIGEIISETYGNVKFGSP
uniref:Uncharacterized protein n=1 Tax=Arundo donax TaxID=35708 RepID=A0A0A8Z113_ARUDO